EGGTLSADAAVVADELDVWSGAVLQTADITVTGLFDWTDGDINAAANPATLHISGATATVEPADAGTVTIGSSWSFENGATGWIEAGTVAFTGGIGIDIGENCTVELDPQRLGLTLRGD